MLGPIIGRRRRNKQFNYQPKYYDPERDPAKRVGKRLRIESKTRRGQGRSVLLIAAVLFLLFFIFLQL